MKQYSFLQEMTPVGLALGGTTAAISATASAVSWKLSNEIKKLKNQMASVETREEAIQLLKDCMIYVDEVTGQKKIKSIGIRNGMANMIVGPCMQIISNESNLNWKSDVIRFLRACIISNRVESIVFGALGVGVGLATAAVF